MIEDKSTTTQNPEPESVNVPPIHSKGSAGKIPDDSSKTSSDIKKSKIFPDAKSFGTLGEILKKEKDKNTSIIFNWNNNGIIMSDSNLNGNVANHPRINMHKNQEEQIRFGDIVRDTNGEERIISIARQKIEHISNVFVKGKNYERLLENLKKNNIFILCGSELSGKKACSIHLLFECGSKEILFAENVDLRHKSLSDFEFLEGKAYILYKPRIQSVEYWETGIMFELSRHLQKKNVKVIVVFDKDQREISNMFLSEFKMEYIPPQPHLIIEKHLTHHYHYGLNKMIEKDELKRFFSLLQNRETIKDYIESCKMIDALEIANFSAQKIKDEIAMDDIIQIIENVFICKIDSIFSSIQNYQEKLFIITLAFFEKSPYKAILDAFERLADKLIPYSSEEDKEQIKKNTYMNQPKNERLKSIHAVSYFEEVEREYSKDSIEHLRFQSASYAEKIIDYVWDQYEFWREAILDWLFDTQFDNHDCIFAVAASLGRISKYDFACVKERLVSNWIHLKNEDYRLVAALILQESYCHEENKSKVILLARHWAGLDNNPDLNLVSIFLYMVSFRNGTSLLMSSLNDLEKIIINAEKYQEDYRIAYHTCHLIFTTLANCLEDEQNCRVFVEKLLAIQKINQFTARFIREITLTFSGWSYELSDGESILVVPRIYRLFPQIASRFNNILVDIFSDYHFKVHIKDNITDIFKFCGKNEKAYEDVEVFLTTLIRNLKMYYVRDIVDVASAILQNKMEGHAYAKKFLLHLKNQFN